MRIAVVFDCLYPMTTGGGEKQYRQFAEGFQAAGHEVVYLTRKQWDGSDSIVSDGLKVRSIASNLGLYDEAGVRKTPPAIIFALTLFWFLLRRRSVFDVVLVSATPVLNVFASRLALLGTKTSLVVDYLEVWTQPQWVEYTGKLTGSIANALQNLAIRLSPLATAHSQHTQDGLIANGFSGRLIRSPGLISRVSDVEPRFTDDEQTKFIVFAGRHIQDKQVETIPAALAKARETVPDLRAVITGEGPETFAVTQAVSNAGLEDAIDLPGFVSEDELSRLFREAVCLVNPSKREGYGLVVVEAAAYGTPAIVLDHPRNASTELIDEGVNGFISPSTSPNDLGTAMARCVEGGVALRCSTRAWYEDAIKTRTIARTVEQLLYVMQSDQESRRPR